MSENTGPPSRATVESWITDDDTTAQEYFQRVAEHIEAHGFGAVQSMRTFLKDRRNRERGQVSRVSMFEFKWRDNVLKTLLEVYALTGHVPQWDALDANITNPLEGTDKAGEYFDIIVKILEEKDVSQLKDVDIELANELKLNGDPIERGRNRRRTVTQHLEDTPYEIEGGCFASFRKQIVRLNEELSSDS